MGKKNYQRMPDGRLLSQPRDPLTGRRVRVTAETRGDLERQLRKFSDVKERLRWGEIDPRQAARILRPVTGKRSTIGELWERYAPGIPPRSAAVATSTYERRLRPYFEKFQVWELEESKMREWAATLEREGFAPKTIRAAYDWLAGTVRQAIDDGVIDGYPWRGWRPKKGQVLQERERCRTVEELATLLRAARELDQRDWSEHRFADRAVRLCVLALCGLRQGEASGLAWDHVRLDSAVLHVEFQAHRGWPERWPEGRPFDPPKTKPRRIRLHDGALRALEMQRAELERRGWYREQGPVFPAANGAWRRTGQVFKPNALREIVIAAGLPNSAAWTTHSMRHTFAHIEANASGDLHATRLRTGHSSIAQLQHYLEAAGRGLPAPAIPPLPAGDFLGQVLGPRTDVVAEDVLVAEVVSVAPAAVEKAADEQKRATRKRDDAKPWEELAAEWLAAERVPAPRPASVTRQLRATYVRAYQSELIKRRRGEAWELLSPEARALIAERDPEHAEKLKLELGDRKRFARAAGRRARRASLGAWGQAVKRAEKKQGGG